MSVEQDLCTSVVTAIGPRPELSLDPSRTELNAIAQWEQYRQERAVYEQVTAAVEPARPQLAWLVAGRAVLRRFVSLIPHTRLTDTERSCLQISAERQQAYRAAVEQASQDDATETPDQIYRRWCQTSRLTNGWLGDEAEEMVRHGRLFEAHVYINLACTVLDNLAGGPFCFEALCGELKVQLRASPDLAYDIATNLRRANLVTSVQGSPDLLSWRRYLPAATTPAASAATSATPREATA